MNELICKYKNRVGATSMDAMEPFIPVDGRQILEFYFEISKLRILK